MADESDEPFEIGAHFERQWRERILAQKHSLQPQLLAAANRLANVIEKLCPVAMMMTNKGFGTAYGPQGMNAAGYNIAAATNRNSFAVAIDRWPTIDYEALLALVNSHGSAGPVWGMIATAIKEKRPDYLCGGVRTLMSFNGYTENYDQTMKDIIVKGYTPVIVVLVAIDKKKQRSGGYMDLIGLPPTLEAQIDRIERDGKRTK